MLSCDSMFYGVMWFHVLWYYVIQSGLVSCDSKFYGIMLYNLVWCHVIQCFFCCHVIQCLLLSCDSIFMVSCDSKGFFHWILYLHLHLRDDQRKSSVVGNDLLTRVWQFYHVHRTQNNDHEDWNKNIYNSFKITCTNVDIKFSVHDTSLE